VDHIALVASAFGLTAGPIDPSLFVIGTAANAAHGQFVFNPGATFLMWDADGTGAGAAVTLATLTGGSLTLGDLTLI